MGTARVLLHSGQISERGDSSNARNYSRMLSTELGIESLIAFPKYGKNNWEAVSQLEEIGLQVFPYTSFRQLQDHAKSIGITDAYFMNGGGYTGEWIPGARKITHAVFRNYQPHGDVYAHCSEWLSAFATSRKLELLRRVNPRSHGYSFRDKGERIRILAMREEMSSPYAIDANLAKDWVPHCVYPENGDGRAFRRKYGLPLTAHVIGRIGGLDQFNDPAAQAAVVVLLSSRQDLHFCFINTQRFIEHPQVTFIDQVTEVEKWSFYDACDIFLNGRMMGESFGFTIVEPLALGKPVVAPALSRNPQMDRHHLAILKGRSLTYNSTENLVEIVLREIDSPTHSTILKQCVVEFVPSRVAVRFNRVFLQGT